MAAAVEKTPSDKSPKSPAKLGNGQDLRDRLLEHLNAQRRPGQLVRATEVGHNRFRVNFLAPVSAGQTIVTQSYHVVRSQYLLVEEAGGELVITDKTV